jgi:hypothetical protein
MATHYIGVSYADMRDRVDGEVVSQALFGEEVSLSKSENGHVCITTPDGYSGYVPKSAVIPLETPYIPSLWTNLSRVPLYAQSSICKGPDLFLPYGVGVKVLSIQDEEWAQIQLPSGALYFMKRGCLEERRLLLREELALFAMKFLGLPYIWGGRTSFGYDCSGFVQMLYGQMGISLPRDSSMQVNALKKSDAPAVGDLIFWGKSLDRIQHAGCYLGEDRFIHATSKEQKPYLRISSLNDLAWGDGPRALFPYRTFRTMAAD